MRHRYWTLLALWLLRVPSFAQLNPRTVLQDALVLENRGSFETAAKVAKAAIDSRQLSGNELGRGYTILAVACQGAGNLADAQIAFKHALEILEHDPEHPGDYASALENYAGFYSECWVLLSTGARVRLNRTGWRKLLGATSASKNPAF